MNSFNTFESCFAEPLFLDFQAAFLDDPVQKLRPNIFLLGTMGDQAEKLPEWCFGKEHIQVGCQVIHVAKIERCYKKRSVWIDSAARKYRHYKITSVACIEPDLTGSIHIDVAENVVVVYVELRLIYDAVQQIITSGTYNIFPINAD